MNYSQANGIWGMVRLLGSDWMAVYAESSKVVRDFLN